MENRSIAPIFTAIGAIALATLSGCSERDEQPVKADDDSLYAHSAPVKNAEVDTHPWHKNITPREYRLDDFTHKEKELLNFYGIPAHNPTAFQSFSSHLRAIHEDHVEAGQVSMMWEYLLSAIASLPDELRINQWIDACIVKGVSMSEQLAAGKYTVDYLKSLYREQKPPHTPLPEDLIAFLDRRIDELENIRGLQFNAAISHLKINFMTDPYMVQVFLDALDNDIDPFRKERLQGLIKSSLNGRPPARDATILKAVRNLLIEASEGEARLVRSDDYSFEGNPLRTGTDFIYTATLRELFRVDGDSLFPDEIRRILIIGPGVSMVAVDDLRNPRQMVEPFALLDILLEADKVDLNELQVDLLDISPDVISHVGHLQAMAEQKQPISIAIGLKHIQKGSALFSEHFREFGRSIPGAILTENRAITSFYQARKQIQIPPEIVSKLRAIKGDVTTTHLSNGEPYDLVLCFNTLVYMNEKERVLAGIGIQKALSPQGRFIANNGLSKKNDPTQELLGSDYLPLLQKKSYQDYPPESEPNRSPTRKGSRLWVYKKGS